ncbi:MAG: YjfB family protein [Herminiimonas sp.]|nr:YjfB family protein [Herminiimonas sp.]
MDVSSIAAIASNLAATTTSENISVAVLKKAPDSESQTAAALLQTIPAPPNLPGHLGQNINTIA